MMTERERKGLGRWPLAVGRILQPWQAALPWPLSGTLPLYQERAPASSLDAARAPRVASPLLVTEYNRLS